MGNGDVRLNVSSLITFRYVLRICKPLHIRENIAFSAVDAINGRGTPTTESTSNVLLVQPIELPAFEAPRVIIGTRRIGHSAVDMDGALYPAIAPSLHVFIRLKNEATKRAAILFISLRLWFRKNVHTLSLFHSAARANETGKAHAVIVNVELRGISVGVPSAIDRCSPLFDVAA